MKRKPNIILITADSLRGDYDTFLSKTKKPLFLHKISKESTLFENAYSCGPLTPYSFPAIMTGTWPLLDGVPRVGPRITISEVLRKSGYFTIGIISANPYARYFSGEGRGFSVFYEIGMKWYKEKILTDLLKMLWKIIRHNREENLEERIVFIDSLIVIMYNVVKLRHDFLRSALITSIAKILLREPPSDVLPSQMDRAVTQRALRILDILKKESDRPFFMWLHYMSTHIPYGISYEDRWTTFMKNLKRRAEVNFVLREQRAPKELIEKLKKYYSEAIIELDKNVRTLFEGLEEMKLLEDTVIILTSDHGEEFFEHGNFGHLTKMYDENLKIPLFIWGLEERKRIKEYVGSVDIFPTIIEMTRLSETKLGRNLLKVINGQSLLSPKGERVILSEVLTGPGIGKMLIQMMLHKKCNPMECTPKVIIRATSPRGSCWGSFDLGNNVHPLLIHCEDEKLRDIIVSRVSEVTKITPRDKRLKLIYAALRRVYNL